MGVGDGGRVLSSIKPVEALEKHHICQIVRTISTHGLYIAAPIKRLINNQPEVHSARYVVFVRTLLFGSLSLLVWCMLLMFGVNLFVVSRDSVSDMLSYSWI